MGYIIGLAGKAGAGKGAVGDYILKKYGYKQDAFANPIKQAVAVMLGMSVEKLEEKKNAGLSNGLLGKSYREMLQTLGTEWGRDMVNSDIWTILMSQRLEDNSGDNTVITDVRFDNEAELIRSFGGIVLYVDRDTDDCRYVGRHVSELSLSPNSIDYSFYNEGNGLDALHKDFDAFMDQQLPDFKVGS